MTRLTEEDRQIADGAIRMRGQDAWSLAVWRAQGREQEARDYLDEMNACRARVGGKPFAMPEPIRPAGYYNAMSHGRTPDDQPKRKTLGIAA